MTLTEVRLAIDYRPQAIRQHLHLQQGDSVDFIIQDDGEVVVRPATRDVRDLKNILPKPKKAVSLEKMDRAVREGAAKAL